MKPSDPFGPPEPPRDVNETIVDIINTQFGWIEAAVDTATTLLPFAARALALHEASRAHGNISAAGVIMVATKFEKYLLGEEPS